MTFKDQTGRRFGRLVAVEYCGKAKDRTSLWRCSCDCGNEIVVPLRNLAAGNTKSCGCLKAYSNRIYTVGNVGICIANDNDYFWFDIRDLDIVLAHHWRIRSDGRALTRDKSRKSKNSNIFFTRLLFPELEKGLVIDHKNGDVRDNRRCNLRVCTYADNNRHRTTGVRGWTRGSDGAYRPTIRHGGKKIHLGRFDTAEEAERVYYEKAAELYGEYIPEPKRIFFPGLTD